MSPSENDDARKAKGIRITAMPPGHAPLSIREKWVGITIPFPSYEQLLQFPVSDFAIGNENIDGYLVERQKGIDALIRADCFEAAIYWHGYPPLGMYLRFRKDVCELVYELPEPLSPIVVKRRVADYQRRIHHERQRVEKIESGIECMEKGISLLQKECSHMNTTQHYEDDVATMKLRTFCTDCGARVFKD